MAIPLLILFTESLDVRLAVRIEEFLAALLPRRLEFGRCDVPVGPAFLDNGSEVFAEGFPNVSAGATCAPGGLIKYNSRRVYRLRVGDFGVVTVRCMCDLREL